MKTHIQSRFESSTLKSIGRDLLMLLGVAFVLVSAGCKHTAHGVGEDLEDAGEKIQEKTK